jgi:hypothetical protein
MDTLDCSELIGEFSEGGVSGQYIPVTIHIDADEAK